MSLTIASEAVPLQLDTDGVARVSGTRVTLDAIAAAFDSGATAEEIAQDFPTVPLADIYSVIAYCLHHPNSVAAYLNGRLDCSQEIQKDNELRFSPDGMRKRLMARRRT
jgi:uncharacterized protein (DUF433 family)